MPQVRDARRHVSVQVRGAVARHVYSGRGGDCSLFLAPMIHEFGWALDDWDRLGQGQVCADMVECGANVSGGFFADPGYKDVPDLGNLGYPFLEIAADGSCEIGKVEGTGGVINRAICTEQMIYEIHDPAHYITPDVIVDFTGVRLDEVARGVLWRPWIRGRQDRYVAGHDMSLHHLDLGALAAATRSF